MESITLGQARFDLHSPYAQPNFKKVTDAMEAAFAPATRLLYFWDCETQSGVPAAPRRNFGVKARVAFHHIDPATGQLDKVETRMIRRLTGQAIRLSPKDAAAALEAEMPPVVAPVPFATLVDPFKKDHYIKLSVTYEPMYLMAIRQGAGGAPRSWMWVIYPKKFTFRAKLIARCSGEPVAAPEGWTGIEVADPALTAKMRRLLAQDAAAQGGD